jgi:hypothetical protein
MGEPSQESPPFMCPFASIIYSHIHSLMYSHQVGQFGGVLDIVLQRRPHCRCCGFTFCDQCCTQSAEIPYDAYKGMGAQKVCDSCFMFLSIEGGTEVLLEKLFLPIIVLKNVPK